MVFQLQAPYTPRGDQPTAIDALVKGVEGGRRYQTLLGATGTGKTFTIALLYLRLVLQHGGNVVALESGAGLAQRGLEPGGADAPFELGVREHVFQADESLRYEQDESFEQTAQLGRVPAPRQGRQQRQRWEPGRRGVREETRSVVDPKTRLLSPRIGEDEIDVAVAIDVDRVDVLRVAEQHREACRRFVGEESGSVVDEDRVLACGGGRRKAVTLSVDQIEIAVSVDVHRVDFLAPDRLGRKSRRGLIGELLRVKKSREKKWKEKAPPHPRSVRDRGTHGESACPRCTETISGGGQVHVDVNARLHGNCDGFAEEFHRDAGR